jgi:predicted MFS family arabinose efflux permease
MVFGGLTFALVIGVPLGNLLSGPLGYHGVFALVAVVSLLSAVAVRVWVPTVEAPPAAGLWERFTVLRDRRVRLMLGVSVLGVVSAMSVFTYIAPFLSAAADVHGSTVSVLLLGYGLGAFVGNSIGGRAADRFGTMRPLFLSIGAGITLLASLPLTATTVPTAAIVLFLWGIFTWSFNPPAQNFLLGLAPSSGALVLSLNASAIYLGVGMSGVLGGVVINVAGLLALPFVAAVVALGSMALLVLASRPVRESAVEDGGEDRDVTQLVGR